MNNLLNWIHSNTISRTEDKPQVKNLQLKYERYNHINEVLKNVRVKDGGGTSYVDLKSHLPKKNMLIA